MIVVAGCGYVGAVLADRLHEEGHEVLGLTHSAESAARLAAGKPWRVAACDIANPSSVAALARTLEKEVSALVHCASSGRGDAEAYRAVYLEGLKNLRTVFPKAFPVFASSTSVYAQTDGMAVTEESQAEPGRETGRLLRAAEEAALQGGGAVARLAGIYGPGRSFVLKNLLLGKSGIEGAAGAGRIVNQIHRDDAASALAHVAVRRLQGVFNAVDDSPLCQRDLLNPLAELFSLPPPPLKAPDPGRKRGWTSKAVSNARLRGSGWAPRFPSYFAALQHDPDLASSILQLVYDEAPARLPRGPNIVLIGLMGSGKTTVGKIIARKLCWEFIDTDSLIVEQAGGRSIPEIFASEGEAGFRRREADALRGLLGRRNCVIATGGGIITTQCNRPLLRHLGYIVWLEAPVTLLARRTSFNQDRPLLQASDPSARLQSLLAERMPLYKDLADLRIQTQDLQPEESAYGATESARVFFVQQLRLRQSLYDG